MIRLGYSTAEKSKEVSEYCKANDIENVLVIAPTRFLGLPVELTHEHVDFKDVIMYKVYYRLMQEVGPRTLVVVNECLRKQNRYDLSYNCIRNFLLQTEHRVIYQYLPLVDSPEDFMTLLDFDTRSRWKLHKWSPKFLSEIDLDVRKVDLELTSQDIVAPEKHKKGYAKEKRKLIDNIGVKDPHTIPRQLALYAGKAKTESLDPEAWYLGRNNRYKLENLRTYRDEKFPEAPYQIFEFCHNSVEFTEFLALSRQTQLKALVTDLKVDQWYYERAQAWVQRMKDAYENLHG